LKIGNSLHVFAKKRHSICITNFAPYLTTLTIKTFNSQNVYFKTETL